VLELLYCITVEDAGCRLLTLIFITTLNIFAV